MVPLVAVGDYVWVDLDQDGIQDQWEAPVAGAIVSVDGGMPQHHHGLPTQPRVTKDYGDGRYLIEGMKFSMSGWWEIKLKIDGAQGADNVTFNLVLPEKS